MNKQNYELFVKEFTEFCKLNELDEKTVLRIILFQTANLSPLYEWVHLREYAENLLMGINDVHLR